MVKLINLPNGRSWKTQSAALAHFKDMLGRYADNEVIEDRSDHDDLIALLARYDGVVTDQPSKIGVGVELFLRKRNAFKGFSTPGFWVRRTNGSETDFSYIWAVKGEPKSNAHEFYDACRDAVAGDLVAAKRNHFKIHSDENGRVACELTGDLITFEEAHLDHAYPTFGHLVVTFRAARGWQHDVPVGVISSPADGQTTSNFIDPAIAQAFAAFHHQASLLRIVRAKANLSMAAVLGDVEVRQTLARFKPSIRTFGAEAIEALPRPTRAFIGRLDRFGFYILETSVQRAKGFEPSTPTAAALPARAGARYASTPISGAAVPSRSRDRSR